MFLVFLNNKRDEGGEKLIFNLGGKATNGPSAAEPDRAATKNKKGPHRAQSRKQRAKPPMDTNQPNSNHEWTQIGKAATNKSSLN